MIQGLTANSNVFFAPYASLAGNFLYIGCEDGLYKIHLGNPRSYKDMYDATKNHLGYILINESRMFLWNRFDEPGDKTALYVSKIDPQGTNYTTVTNEVAGTGNGVLTAFTHNLTSITGDRFAFGLVVTTNDVTARDDGNGNIVGTGVTGTIDYATGVLDLDFTDPVDNLVDIEVDYQYEDSNSGGITDFTFSAPRVAGEGDFFPQEYLGEPIQNVIPFDTRYYSFKTTSVYELDLTADDTNATNTVYRADIGIPSVRAVTATGQGIAYMDTANPEKPFLSLLIRNPVGGNLEPTVIAPEFAWYNYRYDKCIISTWSEFILVSCRTPDSDTNNRLIFVNSAKGYSASITYYGALSHEQNDGILYLGGPISEVVYQTFTVNDDLGSVVENFWTSKDESFGDDRLKRERYIELKGLIDTQQNYEVYISYDGGENVLVGTVRGDQSYVDTSNPQFLEISAQGQEFSALVGGDPIGRQTLGGGATSDTSGTTVVAYPYHTRIKLRTPKFRVRRVTIIATNYGYCSVNMLKDFDIMTYEQRIPRVVRVKEYVSLDGVDTDLPHFET